MTDTKTQRKIETKKETDRSKRNRDSKQTQTARGWTYFNIETIATKIHRDKDG